MKTIMLVFLLVVATASCHTPPNADVQSEEGTHDSDTPPEYSRVNQEVYKAYATPQHQAGNKKSHITPPPIPKLSPPTRTVTREVSVTSEEYSRPKAIKPPQPTPQKAQTPVDNEGRLTSRPQTYFAPEETPGTDTDGIDPCTNEYNDPLPEPVDYQQNQYPVTPIPQPPIYNQPSAPARRPAVFAPEAPLYRALVRALRRGFSSPVIRRPTFAGIINRPAPIYGPVDYTPPVAYAVPTARRIVYGPAPLRYVQRPSISYEGIGGVDYDNIVNVDYDVIKK